MDQTTINPEVLDSCEILACADALTVLRSLSDGLWATPGEVAVATPLACERTEAILNYLARFGVVDIQGGQFRLNGCQLAEHCHRIRSLVSA